ncbi:hypothetical protein VHEMI08621 [[Torrubiella] hemipterigena]|nr:hypothetical protein VHEMI08621 [[Torrubiella] hemipterigena]
MPASRRVRVIYNNTVIVDSTKGIFVWEHPWYPHYYFPVTEIKNATLGDAEIIEGTGNGSHLAALSTLTVAAREDEGIKHASTDRVLRFVDDAKLGPLAGLVRLEFGSMDQWLEEDIPIYVHPKDPFKRVDILPSSREIEVRVDGQTVAKSSFAMHLFETGLPTRYYLPLGSVNVSVLRRSDLTTKCPYKGEAEYYHIFVGGKTHENLVWYYRNPIQESIGIAGLVCFYNEKVEILVDGEKI